MCEGAVLERSSCIVRAVRSCLGRFSDDDKVVGKRDSILELGVRVYQLESVQARLQAFVVRFFQIDAAVGTAVSGISSIPVVH